MKRPDADMIRKVKKAMGITRGASVGYKRLKKVLEMPYFYMSYKPMREFDFTTPDDTPHDVVREAGQDYGGYYDGDWTLNDDQIARQFAPRAEFVYDEFVLSARNQIVLKHKGHIEQVSVNYWGYVGHRKEADAVFVMLEYPDTGEMFNWEGMILEKETLP